MRPKKFSAVYRTAARQVDKLENQGHAFSCLMVGQYSHAAESGYNYLFDLRNHNENELWNMSNDKRREMRVLMLLLASAIAESEGELIDEET